MKTVAIAIGLSLGLTLIPAHAEVIVGVTLSATGSGASPTMSAQNHNGFDERAVVPVKIEGGDWKLIK